MGSFKFAVQAIIKYFSMTNSNILVEITQLFENKGHAYNFELLVCKYNVVQKLFAQGFDVQPLTPYLGWYKEVDFFLSN